MGLTMESFFPAPQVVTELQPAELAMFVLAHLQHLSAIGQRNSLILLNYVRGIGIDGYAGQLSVDVSKAFVEAWIWLEREGMIAPDPSEDCQLIYITKRGERLLADADVGKYLKEKLISEGALDPVLRSKVEPLFMRGDYDTAVFQAFKEVEVRVRAAAKLKMEDYGVDLMRKAFNPDTGALTDSKELKAEQEATSHLFAGAIGLFKNPSSHRNVDWEDPSECAELIYFANYLLRLIGRRGKQKQSE